MAKEALKQVNVRIGEAAYQLLEAIAYLEETQHSPLLRPIIEDFVAAERAAHPLVDEVMALRAKQRAKKGAPVLPIKRPKKTVAKPHRSRSQRKP